MSLVIPDSQYPPFQLISFIEYDGASPLRNHSEGEKASRCRVNMALWLNPPPGWFDNCSEEKRFFLTQELDKQSHLHTKPFAILFFTLVD